MDILKIIQNVSQKYITSEGGVDLSNQKWNNCKIEYDHFCCSLSIPVFPKMWDTELLCTEYARKYWLNRVPVNLSPRRLSVDRRWNYLTWILFDSSHMRLSVNRRWNYLARVLVNSSPRRPSVDRRWNYLARVPVVRPSNDAETVDSHPSCLSFNRINL